MKWKLIICLLSCVLADAAAAARTPQAATEEQCGTAPQKPAQRVFAQVNEHQSWREYKRLEDAPELALGFGSSAELWTGHDQAFLIRIDEPGEDFEAYTEYCFNKGGQLIHLAYELRTAWGWAFRMGGPVSNGVIHSELNGFFSTDSGKPIRKPENASDVREALKPKIFQYANRLPFSRLLSR